MSEATENSDEPRGYQCIHIASRLTRRKIANGSIHCYRQCLVCGWPVGSAVAKADVQNFDDLPEWDGSIQVKRDEIVRADIEEKRRETEIEKQAASDKWWEIYQRHIKSPEWFRLRRKVLDRASRVCEGCGEAEAVQAHHLTYEHLTCEFLWELKAVCIPCHERFHDKVIG